MTPKILTDRSTVEGCNFVQKYIYKNGHTVPIYDVITTNALNQLIGHAKFDNASYGNVYYRGVSQLYDNVLPSIMRNRTHGIPCDITSFLAEIYKDQYLKESLKLKCPQNGHSKKDKSENHRIEKYNKYRIEALWQHYGGSTRFLDVVDNHWVALWMGLHKFTAHGERKEFYDVNKRSSLLSALEIYERTKEKDKQKSDLNIYTYILLIAMPHSYDNHENGIYETSKFIEVDLRKALPSTFLRPHAQHALVIRRKEDGYSESRAKFYDMASQVVAILRIRIDRVAEWLGNGTLLTKENLFPSPSIDQGYNNLLKYFNKYDKPFNIKKYF